MKHLLYFLDFKSLNEKIQISQDNITINDKEYEVSGKNVKINNEKAPKEVSKYISKLKDVADDTEKAEETYDIDRVTGEIPELKKKIKDDKINIKVNSTSFNEVKKQVTKFKSWTYIPIDKNYNDIFDLPAHAVGRGEVLISVLYNDTERHNITNKGDNVSITDDKYEIEVKSGGSSMPIIKPGDSDDISYICAYSIGKYIAGRNLDQIYLVIFDNGIESIEKTANIDSDDTESKINTETSEESTSSSNANGKSMTKGFFIMNCGKSVNPNSNKCKEHAKEIANELQKIIYVKNPEYKKGKSKKFVFRYEHSQNENGDNTNSKIICTLK